MWKRQLLVFSIWCQEMQFIALNSQYRVNPIEAEDFTSNQTPDALHHSQPLRRAQLETFGTA
jgi:hypothetical protein